MAGVPELVLLRLLASHEMYGYEIARDLRLISADAIALGEGVIYPALHSLEARGLLRTRVVEVEGRRRVYYRVTSRGHARLEKLTAEWRRIAGGVEAVLKERTP